jgi:hypothetical protein
MLQVGLPKDAILHKMSPDSFQFHEASSPKTPSSGGSRRTHVVGYSGAVFPRQSVTMPDSPDASKPRALLLMRSPASSVPPPGAAQHPEEEGAAMVDMVEEHAAPTHQHDRQQPQFSLPPLGPASAPRAPRALARPPGVNTQLRAFPNVRKASRIDTKFHASPKDSLILNKARVPCVDARMMDDLPMNEEKVRVLQKRISD